MTFLVGAAFLLLIGLLLYMNRTYLRIVARQGERLKWKDKQISALKGGVPHFACPKCGAVSFQAQDLEYGWCGKCMAYTGEQP